MLFTRGVIAALALLLFLSGCQAAQSRLRQPLADEGELVLYMQPFPQEAGRLRLTIESIAAVRSDGTEIPLSLAAREFTPRDPHRQKRLAAAVLPPGSYTGLSFKIKRASLTTEEGEAALLAPEQPETVSFPFSVERRKVSVLFFTLHYAKSVREGFSFVPAFTIETAARPIVGLLGYVTNAGANSITVFNKRTGFVENVVAVGRAPSAVVIDQVRRRAYIALAGESAVQVIDILNGDELGRIALYPGDEPQSLALARDGSLLLSANRGSDSVSFLDPISFVSQARVTVGRNPSSILLDPAGRRAYVFNTGASSVSVVDIANRRVFSTIATETAPLRGQFNRSGDRLYIYSEWSPYLLVVNTATFGTVRRVYIGGGVSALKVDPVTDLVYVGKRNSPDVEIYDPFSFIPAFYIRVGGMVSYMTIDPDLNTLWMVLPERNAVASFTLTNRRPAAEVETGDDPSFMALVGER